MSRSPLAFAAFAVAVAVAFGALACRSAPARAPSSADGGADGGGGAREVRFRKVVIDPLFRAEGAAVADVNRDGKLDILVGNLWYEAPAWTPREIAPPLSFDPATQFSNAFLVFAHDVDGDGWADEIVFDFPGRGVSWRRNPQNAAGHWEEHAIWPSVGNESPTLVDLHGDGSPVLVFHDSPTSMGWFAPGPDVRAQFVDHRFEAPSGGVTLGSHGLGIGDVDGDGRNDVLVPSGYWRAPSAAGGAWGFVRAAFGPDCAQMYVLDVDGDGLADVVTSSAHNVGVWWHKQSRTAAGPAFEQRTIDATFSQSHSLVVADLNGDGLPDLVTGKRMWAHGPNGDVDPNAPRVLYWFELVRDASGARFVKHLIDDDSGVGTQFVVTDVNGDRRPDLVIANKRGVFYFEQL